VSQGEKHAGIIPLDRSREEEEQGGEEEKRPECENGRELEEEPEQVSTLGDLHRLASLTDRVAAGADDGVGLLIGVAILIILIIVIFKLMNKEIVVR